MPDQGRLIYNGVIGESGRHAATVDPDELFRRLLEAHRMRRPRRPVQSDSYLDRLGPPPSIDPDDLAEAGWGVIWPPAPLTSAEQVHVAALKELIVHRRRQLRGREPAQFWYRDGWSYAEFLWREGREIEPGSMEPRTVPYYLCLVGSPERIPWTFQEELGAEYAVGRLWFDRPVEAAQYVERMIAVERGLREPVGRHNILLFGTQHRGDGPTQRSSGQLVRPLESWLRKGEGPPDWTVSLLLGTRPDGAATKHNLLGRLRGSPPAVLFAVAHGLEYRRPTDQRRNWQGSILCQEWPGPLIPPEPGHYLAADDIDERIFVDGGIVFCIACHGAGSPPVELWLRGRSRRQSAAPFVARLPQRLLARGLAVFIGHVADARDSSFMGIGGTAPQLGPLRETLSELLRGRRAGYAVNYLATRALHLTALLDRQLNDRGSSREQILATCQARDDCRGYVILGDPAASTPRQVAT